MLPVLFQDPPRDVGGGRPYYTQITTLIDKIDALELALTIAEKGDTSEENTEIVIEDNNFTFKETISNQISFFNPNNDSGTLSHFHYHK